MKIHLAIALVLSAASLSVFAADAAKGKAVFEAKCATCHGKDGKGNIAMVKMFKLTDRAPMDLTDSATQGKMDTDLAGLISKGKDKMPGFKGKLKDGEIADVVAYARSLSAAAAPAETPAKAEEVKPPALPANGKEPEFIVLDKTATGASKMPAVKFPHAAHGQRSGCAACHEGEKPLFAQKRSAAGMKMADMYKGETCGACHNGKTKGPDGKAIFAAKTSCLRCHKK